MADTSSVNSYCPSAFFTSPVSRVSLFTLDLVMREQISVYFIILPRQRLMAMRRLNIPLTVGVRRDLLYASPHCRIASAVVG